MLLCKNLIQFLFRLFRFFFVFELMISTYSCKNPIQSTIHQPLQIRTNKHRCFVFCLGHTSLTCVPGIGKKNKYLLNQSGIYDLSTLYSKYRSINNIQHFKQWLQNEIGFTSYQAKMTSCGIGSKLGDIKEINTGLTPICCSLKEKRDRSIQSKNEKKRKIENISHEPNKEENLFSQKNDQIFSSPEEKITNKLSDSMSFQHSSERKKHSNFHFNLLIIQYSLYNLHP